MCKKLIIGFVVVIIVVPTAIIAVTQSQSFDKQAMIRSTIANAIYPSQDNFIVSITQLEEAVQTFADNPTVETLQTMQDEWRNVSHTWSYVEYYEFDRLMVLHNRISKRPINIENIEAIIASDDVLDATYIENIGSTSKGLSVLEYLLFNPDKSDEDIIASLIDGEYGDRRLQYVLALVQNLQMNAEAIRDFWREGDENYTDTFIQMIDSQRITQNSVNLLANEMLRMMEKIYLFKIDFPFGGKTVESTLPFEVEAWRSRESFARLESGLQAFRVAFQGGYDDNSLGFDDYLDSINAEYNGLPMSEAIEAQIEGTLEAIDAVDMPFHEALTEDYEAAWHVHQQARQLLIMVKVDMTSAASITITFNDVDGD